MPSLPRPAHPPHQTALRLLLALLVLGLFPLFAAADTFVLKDGRRLEGTLVREEAGVVTIKTALGEIEIERTNILKIIEGKTSREEYAEREQAARSADDFFELGNWAKGKRLGSLAKKAWKRAVALDPQHAGAQTALGMVLYKGEWMTPEERDQRAVDDEEADMLARGLVRYEERWVTPGEKEKLEAGLVLYENEWIPYAESMQRQGFEDFEGAWLPRAQALARGDVRAVEKLVGSKLPTLLTAEASVAGTYPMGVLEETGRALDVARAWFNGAFTVEPGLELLGGRLAEFYLWNRDSQPFEGTVEHFQSRTHTLPEGWSEVAKRTHGFYFVDPYCVSSARVLHRPEPDLVGHCVHHWGHMMLNRLQYDGRLLPPWYDEALAALAEFVVFERNAVFCRASGSVSESGGTSARSTTTSFSFDPGMFREGGWRDTMKKALDAGSVGAFDKLAQKQFSQLELIDVAFGMAVLEWLESHEGALGRFHVALRESRPDPPRRLIEVARERHAAYDTAFTAAVGLSSREADQAWRKWFLTR